MEWLQPTIDFGQGRSVGTIIDRIRSESRDESEKGRWFEQLFMRVAQQEPEFEIANIHRWTDWPEREEVTGFDGRDFGIDLVGQRTSGEWIAIQCKCYDSNHTLPKSELDKFLGASQQAVFTQRWVVATCPWGRAAEAAIQRAHPQVAQIDINRYRDVQVLEEEAAERPIREPWPLQAEAIEDTVEGLRHHARGRLTMACGTGKTFTALRVAEQAVPNGGRILFAAPTIALVSQARREWLRHTTRPLACRVICSDPTAGGRNENEDMRISELECPVTTDPEAIAETLTQQTDNTRVVFCTYQSLHQVLDAQAKFGSPPFDLAIADEAHRTTGALARPNARDRKTDFQAFHDSDRLGAERRLYMTATPRLYTQASKGRLRDRGIDVVDMGDYDVYGPELHRLPFAKAVQNDMLSDYRVIVLGVNRGAVTPRLQQRLEDLDDEVSRGQRPDARAITRVLGTMLAVNGLAEGDESDRPGRLRRTLAFANSIRRSKWFAKALGDSEVKRRTTLRLASGQRAMNVEAQHVDASSTALVRNRELRKLAEAERDDTCRILTNVRLFTEGVDVPELDAVAFLDPRDSQVDVVQAVGRVMRKAEGKRFGYIVIPVIVEPGADLSESLEQGSDGYHTVGRVLRALQAHDGRLSREPARFVKVFVPEPLPMNGHETNGDGDSVQLAFDLKDADPGIFAHVVAASGLGQPGRLVADEIADSVRRAAGILQNEYAEDAIAQALAMTPEADGGAKGICTVGALLLANACLLQRRLRDEPAMQMLLRLDQVAGASDPKQLLEFAWEVILQKDYRPVFEPALKALRALPPGRRVANAVRILVECANRTADSLSDLGYDHAGPLYHRILGSAKSDGAYYTKNLSAILLTRLALSDDLIDWSDTNKVNRLRIMDPACGTGTLLMGALHTIKARVNTHTDLDETSQTELHKNLVEDVLCGIDINQHAVQLAACNLTLGSPSVDYARMNLITMPHGPQRDGTMATGSLEVLAAAENEHDMRSLTDPQRNLEAMEGEQIDAATRIEFPLQELDAVIMNPPFTNNVHRSSKYTKETKDAMRARERVVKQAIEERDGTAVGVVDANSIETYFSPLADHLLGTNAGTLAQVMPTTACTGASSATKRKFLASKFHVETVVTSHDPRHPNFSENTSIHESLLVCRRLNPENRDAPTRFISIAQMPHTAAEAIELADAIASTPVTYQNGSAPPPQIRTNFHIQQIQLGARYINSQR